MKINLLAIGKKMPKWVTEGVQEYCKRLPNDFNINLIEHAALKRSKNADLNNIMQQESKLLMENIPRNNKIIALDRQGESLTTLALSKKLMLLHSDNQAISLLIGGPEGISENCLQQADEQWSLSALTLPHPLIRLVVAEQIYRAWTIINKHPYHR